MIVRVIGRAAWRVGFGGAVAAGVVGLMALPLSDPDIARELAGGALRMAVIAIAALACWRASKVSTVDATAWRAMAAGLAVFALCAAAFSATELFDLSDRWLTVAAVLGLLFRLLAALAMMSFPLSASTARSRWRGRLDLLVVAATVAYIAWGWVLSGLFQDAQRSAPAARAAMFSLLDIVLVIIVLMASLGRPSGVRDSARLVGGGLVFLAITDWNVGSELTAGHPHMSSFAWLTSFIALVLIAAGAWSATHPVDAVRRPMVGERGRNLLPIVLAAVALSTTIASGHPWVGDPVLMVLAVTSAVSLLAWQVAVVLESEEMVQSLSEQGQRFKMLVETAPIAIIETDPEGVVQVVNSEAGRILGEDPTGLLGIQLDVEAIDAPIGSKALRNRVLQGETIRDLRVPLRRSDGATLEMLISAAPIANRTGEVTRVVWIGSDDGPRLRGLAAMIDVQRMQAYEQLTSGIAHDFNNRLTVILGTTEILLDQATSTDDREMLESVLAAGKRAAALVEQLVGTTRRKSDEQERLDLTSLLAQLEPELLRRAPAGITIDVELEDEPLPIQADWSDLEQAVTNLVVNAYEAMPTGGTVFVRAHRANMVGEGRELAAVELVVSDDGEGMDAVTRTRIFEPFFTTKVGGGRSRGLGLPAVQGVVLRSRGELLVDSAPGLGTTVTVHLPLHEQRPVAPPALVPPVDVSLPHTAATILLVDDEPEVRAVASRVLTGAGYTVVDAAGAEEALAIVLACSPEIDLLVSDVVMPGRSGIDLAHDFADLHPGRPILLLSGFVGESAHGGLAADLPFPLLSKPISRLDLLAAVAAALPTPV